MDAMHFHKQKNLLLDWLPMNRMSTGEIVLYLQLMNVGNRLGRRRKFNMPTSMLMHYTGLSKTGMQKARKKLVDRGFIRHYEGDRYRAPIYEIMPLEQVVSSYYFPDENDKNQEEKGDSNDSNSEECPQEFPQESSQENPSQWAIHKEKEKVKKREEEESVPLNLIHLFEQNICPLSMITRQELVDWVDVFDESTVEEAIRITAKKNGRTFNYTERVLQEWKKAGLATLDEVLAYEEKKLETKSNRARSQNKKPKQKKNNDWIKEFLEEEE